jgi:type I restriction enzyme, S subunit
VKTGWQTNTLGELCEFQRGLTYAKGDEVESSENVVLRATNINLATNLLDFSELKYISDKVAVPESKKIKKGSLMICTASGSKSHLGKVAFIDDDYGYAFGGFMGMVTPKNGLLPKYLFHLMTSVAYKDFIGALSDGANINNLKFDDLKRFVVPHPPLPEQKRIVGILDEAFDGIAITKSNAEMNLQNARALFESHLQSVFTQRGKGWVEKYLEELGTITSSKRIFKNEYVKSGVPFYRTKEIKELANGREITTELFISEARYNQIRAKFGVPKQGDILLTAIGTIGEIYVIEGEDDFYFKDGNVLWLKDFTSINPHFLKYVLISFVESLNKMAHGAAYSALPIQRLNAHRIFLPSLAEQSAIVAQLDDLREETQRLESTYQQKLAVLSELKKSLLHQAFSGQL